MATHTLRTTATHPEMTPPLASGDHLSMEEFDRRYEAMPAATRAELLTGVVYMQVPASEEHGQPHLTLAGWIYLYVAMTPNVIGGDNTSTILSTDSVLQPDVYLRIDHASGGQSRLSSARRIEGAPELVAEVAATSASYDLHEKLELYRTHGLREYLVWRVYDKQLDWFILRGSEYEQLPASADGVYRSEVFPGLWLDKIAMLAGDHAAVIRAVQVGTASPEHAALVARLKQAAEAK